MSSHTHNKSYLKSYLFALLYDLSMLGPVETLVLGPRRRKLIAPLRGVILEIGAGTGLSLRHYSHEAMVVATDPDIASLHRLLDKTQHVHVRGVALAASATHLPFTDATFDGLVCNLALCTIPDPAGALAEVRRVLKPGAPARFLEHVKADNPLSARLQDLLAPWWARIAGGCRLNQDTERIIRRSGLKVERVVRHSGLLVPMRSIWARS